MLTWLIFTGPFTYVFNAGKPCMACVYVTGIEEWLENGLLDIILLYAIF